MTGKGVGGRPYFPPLGSFHKVLKIWQLTSRVGNPKTKVEDTMSFMTNGTGHITHFYITLLALPRCGRGLTRV